MGLNLLGRTELFTMEDVASEIIEYQDQILVFSPNYIHENFTPPYQAVEHQLFLAQGGFGVHSYTMGRAVIGKFLSDGETVRYDRGDFLGVLKPELVEKYNLKERVKELTSE